MHANDVFLFFKNHFWHQHIKTIQNIQTILNFSKKKNKKKFKFFGNAVCTVFPNAYLAVSPGKHNVVYYTLSIHQNTSMRDETKINNMSSNKEKKYIYILLDHFIPPLCTEFQIIRNWIAKRPQTSRT
jgi:hypothetical protein